MAEPILKWAGGKRQILDDIRDVLPPKSEFNCYHEPFFGGGAVFFRTGPHDGGSTINDINPRLMSFYEVVQNNPDDLLDCLDNFKRPKEPPNPNREFSDTNRKGKDITEYYYQQRELFNRRPNGEEYDKVEEAALFLYLNRCCYNGLYRENQSGEFNTPIGSQTNPNWRQERRIKEAHKLLEGIDIKKEDFSYIEDEAETGDLVYFDPPYEPVSQTSSFVEYSSEAFSTEEQKRLGKLAERLSRRGVYVVISNSPPMRELYQNKSEFDVRTIGATRAINSDGDGRGEVGEILVTNVPDEYQAPQEEEKKISNYAEE